MNGIYIYLSSVLGHGTNLCRVQNGQDGRPLRSHCVRLKYSPRIASNGKEIVRNEADTPTSPSGKDTGIGRRNHPTNLPPRSRNSQDPKRSSPQSLDSQVKRYAKRTRLQRHLPLSIRNSADPPLNSSYVYRTSSIVRLSYDLGHGCKMDKMGALCVAVGCDSNTRRG